MKEYLKKIKFLTLFISLAYMAFGICLIAIPSLTRQSVVILIGSMLASIGVVEIANYFLYGYEPFGFLNGVITGTFGIIVLCSYETFASLTIFAVTFGIIFIFRGLFEVQYSMDYRRMGGKYWWLKTIIGTALFIFGFVVLFNPFTAERVLNIVIGSVIVVDAIMAIVSTLVTSCRIRKIHHSFKDMFKIEDKNDDDIIDIE